MYMYMYVQMYLHVYTHVHVTVPMEFTQKEHGSIAVITCNWLWSIMCHQNLVPVTIATGITAHIIKGTGGDRGSLAC